MNKLLESSCLHCKKRSDIFGTLSDEELGRVDMCRVNMRYHAGEIIFKQGSPCYDFVCVTTGLVKLYIEAENRFQDVLKDVDVLVAYGNEELLAAMQNDALLSLLPAVENGSVALIEDGSNLSASCTPSAISIPATIDEYLSIIGKAADLAK